MLLVRVSRGPGPVAGLVKDPPFRLVTNPPFRSTPLPGGRRPPRTELDARAAADGSDDELPRKVASLLTAIFPEGVQAVTQMTFVEELAAVDGILASLESKELAPIVADLGLGRLAKRLAALAADYRAALEPAADNPEPPV